MSVEQPSQPTTHDVPAQANPWAPTGGMPPVAATDYGRVPAGGPVGTVRGTGVCILLTVVTLGIYSLVWYYQTHEEMKRHSGQGLGGVVALLLAVFIGVASPFLSSNEVGDLYKRRGQAEPVSVLTGLWFIPGVFLLIGPIVWFVKTNSALNAYWRSLGAE